MIRSDTGDWPHQMLVFIALTVFFSLRFYLDNFFVDKVCLRVSKTQLCCLIWKYIALSLKINKTNVINILDFCIYIFSKWKIWFGWNRHEIFKQFSSAGRIWTRHFYRNWLKAFVTWATVNGQRALIIVVTSWSYSHDIYS